MDKFASIKAFIAVVEEGGFAAAARKLDLSRSAVNKFVINLESYLGVQLFYRTTRKVTPTDDGRSFYDRCTDILSSLEEAELAVSQQNQQPRGILKVNAPMSFGISVLGRKVTEFINCYPEIRVQLTLEDRFIDPITEGYDLTIRVGSIPESPNLVVKPIKTLPRLICASPEYLKKQGYPQTLQELKHHHCLHYGYDTSGCQWVLVKQQNQEKVNIQPIFCANNGEVLKETAIQGLGIAILPEFILETSLKQGLLQPILPEYQAVGLNLCLVYPLNRHLSNKVRLFSQFIQDSLS